MVEAILGQKETAERDRHARGVRVG